MGCSFLSSIRSDGSTIAAMGQRAVLSGRIMFLWGLRILADSAMKLTPQKMMLSASRAVAFLASSSESPV